MVKFLFRYTRMRFLGYDLIFCSSITQNAYLLRENST